MSLPQFIGGGWANANLRTTVEKIIVRAGFAPWPRLWHSLRASCETDLARQFPLAVVTKWLGNTQVIAMRHYVDVTDADFERALTMASLPAAGLGQGAGVAQKAAQQTAVGSGTEQKVITLQSDSFRSLQLNSPPF